MKITIVAVVEMVEGTSVPDALHAWAHDAMVRAGADPVFVAAQEGVCVPAVMVADRLGELTERSSEHECAFCASPIPASVHIPHSTAELPAVDR